jgi:hypothetical protein
MAQRETRIPSPMKQPLIILESVQDFREMIEDAQKRSNDAGRTERDRYRFIRLKALLNDLESNAKARVGSQVDGA